MFGLFTPKKPEPPSVEERIIEIMKLKGSKVTLRYGKVMKGFDYGVASQDNSVIIEVEYMKKSFIVSCVEDFMYDGYNIDKRVVVMFTPKKLGQVDIEDYIKLENKWWRDILKTAEDTREQEVLKQLYPLKAPELEGVFNDVQEIEDSKDQIEFLVQKINEIRSKY